MEEQMEFLIIGSVVMASVVIYKIGHTHGKTLGHTNGLNEAIRLQKEQKIREQAQRAKPFVGVKTRISPAYTQEPAWMG